VQADGPKAVCSDLLKRRSLPQAYHLVRDLDGKKITTNEIATQLDLPESYCLELVGKFVRHCDIKADFEPISLTTPVFYQKGSSEAYIATKKEKQDSVESDPIMGKGHHSELTTDPCFHSTLVG
jgi:hypothetical protein